MAEGTGKAAPPPARLPPQQGRMLRHLGAGTSHKAIAQAMALSAGTAMTPVRAVCRRPGARMRTHAATIANPRMT
jgi:DNA-binding NarL/FixJ family response regulator